MLKQFPYIFYFIYYFLSRQGETCKDKIDAGKTPRSVGQFWISEIFSKNQHVGLGVSLRGVTNFAKISAKNESFTKTILACLSGAQAGQFHKRKKCQKISYEVWWSSDQCPCHQVRPSRFQLSTRDLSAGWSEGREIPL